MNAHAYTYKYCKDLDRWEILAYMTGTEEEAQWHMLAYADTEEDAKHVTQCLTTLLSIGEVFDFAGGDPDVP